MSKKHHPQQQQQTVVTTTQASLRVSPFPDPREIAEYERIYPGAAKIVFEMTQRHSEHRMFVEKEALTHQAKQIDHNRIALDGGLALAKRNQWFAFFICTAILGFGAFLAVTGKSAAGFTLILTETAALVALFIYQERQKQTPGE